MRLRFIPGLQRFKKIFSNQPAETIHRLFYTIKFSQMTAITRNTFTPLVFLLSVLFFSCKKTTPPSPAPPPTPPGPVTPDPITPAVDPAIANTIGFFLDDWQPKTFVKPPVANATAPASATTTVTMDASDIITKIPLSVFGQNAVWWMGPSVMDATPITNLTNLHPHIIRFPGGSSSDVYFWNQDAANPADAPTLIKDKDGVDKAPGYNYGKTTLNWQFSLDNYYAMLQQTHNQGIITVNFGYSRYGTSADPVATAAHLAADWVRYDNGRTKYWEVGNENYGDWEWGYRINTALNKDGQPEYLTGSLYAKHFKVFADSMKKAATEIGKTIYIGAVTAEAPANEPWQTNTLKTWNSGMMPGIDNKADFYVVHNYFTPYDQNSNAAVVLTSALTVPGQMISFVTQTLQTNGAAVKPIAMDEWNMWAKDSKQQVSNTSGLFAILVMGESLKNKYGLAARWDLLNGWDNGNDHGMFSAGDEPGIPKWSPRPSFYYMYYFQKYLGDRLVSNIVQGSADIKAYASTYTSGEANISVVNTGASVQTVEVKIKNFNAGTNFYWYTLEGSNDNGEFSRKVLVNGSGPALAAGGPSNYATLEAKMAATTNGIKVTIPARGMVCIVVDKK